MSIEEKIRRLDKQIDEIRDRIKGLEDFKTFNEVFDKSTLLTLYKLLNKGYIDIMYGVIKTGKEANVFLGLNRNGERVAVKIYRIATSEYKNMIKYIEGDWRFARIRKGKRNIVFLWVQKEFKNLETAYKCGVRVPKPIAYKNNVLVMEFLGVDDTPYPMLKFYEPENPRKIFEKVVEYMAKLYRCNLVHGDLSEYNILIDENEEPILIDFSQAVPLDHPNAMEFLERDVRNICRYFSEYFSVSFENIYKYVTGG